MNRPYTGGKIDVSVVIPAHNEEANVGPLLEQFNELARRVRFGFEVVVVNDGSTDKTLARLVDAQRVHRFLRVVSIPYRRGLTEALQAGFGVAQGAILVFYPADRQFHPNDIPRMIDKVREGYDLVTGRKIGVYNKRAVSGLYNRISRWLFPSIGVTDLNSVKAFRRELVDVFDYRHDWHRFWVAIVAEQGYRIAEVDVTLYPRPAGRSKFGFWRIPGGVLDLLAVKFQYHTMRRPLWYFGITGSILLTAAVLLGLLALYQRFALNHGYRPLLYLVMTLGISGVVFFTLGFLAESVAGIRQQIESLRERPKFRLFHPAPPGSTTAQLTSIPSADVRAPRSESESRPAPREERERTGGSGAPRPQRPPERRGDARRRRGPDQREGRSPLPRVTRGGPVPGPVSSDVPVADAVASDESELDLREFGRPIPSRVPEEVEREIEQPHASDEMENLVAVEPPVRVADLRQLEEPREDEGQPERQHPDASDSGAIPTESVPKEPAAPEKRPQYGRRNRP
jgi:glycosyltransferase involved in cell wall biosynthesis